MVARTKHTRAVLGGAAALLALTGGVVAGVAQSGEAHGERANSAQGTQDTKSAQDTKGAQGPKGTEAARDTQAKGGTSDDRSGLSSRAAQGGSDTALKRVAGKDNIYYIVNKHSGKCLTVKGASKAENAPVNQYRCVSAKNQMWVVHRHAGITRRYENYNSHKALSYNGRAAKGAGLVQRSYVNDLDHQLWWSLVPNASGRSAEISAYPAAGKLCLDAQGASKADNAPVILWNCNDRGNQAWTAKG
ncbi:RICIN domain-containing protein [Streptomyces iconiensis]|uniref:RICIN domain-containing protein n=1 Tax=Streptomyces iconiensis TaxID=1384038 RepID=A0ABT7A845_9ACTN|nr:RICIN domain-containing protein [Streptomyces iconiensis]MDJ1137506.1 RICIN domain-containing protein [Streptomyces iconiensis]